MLSMSLDAWAQCSFTVMAPNATYCGPGMITINASATTADVSWTWSFSPDGAGLSFPAEIDGITYTIMNSGATIRIDGVDGPGGVTDPSYIYVRGTKSGCTASHLVSIAYGAPTVNAGVDQTVCGNASPIFLTGSPSGGTWSGTGVSESTFTPNTSYIGSPKTITYSYTSPSGCTGTDTRIITIEGVPNATETLEACGTTGAVVLPEFGGATGTWSGNNVSGNYFIARTAATNTTIQFNYTTTAHGCTGTANQVVHVYPHSAVAGPTVSVAGGSSLCGSGSATLTASGFGTGKYLWYYIDGSPILKPDGSILNTSSYNTGTLTSSTTFQVQGMDGQDCGSKMVEAVALVTPAPASPVMINGSNCSDGLATIAISSASSSYSYEWIDSNNVPIHTSSSEEVDYILANNQLKINGIQGNSDFAVHVRAVSLANTDCKSTYVTGIAVFRVPPTVSIGTSIPDVTCKSTPTFVLTGATPTGGIWKINNVVSSSFAAGDLSNASNNVIYTYTDQFGCSNTASKVIAVNTLLSPAAQTFRTVHGTAATLQPPDPGSSKTFNWYSASIGGTPIIAAKTLTTSNVTSPLTYYISLKDTTIASCESVDRATISVFPNYLPIVDAGPSKNVILPNRNVTLDGSASDPDGSIKSTSWSKLSGPNVTLTNTQILPLAITNLPNGRYLFKLTAVDNYDFIVWDTVTIVVTGPGNNRNRVITEIITVPSVTSSSSVETLSEYQKSRFTQYIDGLGRPEQQVQWRGSINRTDIIHPVIYDRLGLEPIKYLPYTSTLNNGNYKEDAIDAPYPNSKQWQFYNGSDGFIASDTVPNSKTVFELSPLNRIIEQGAPGVDWQPGTNHTIKMDYLSNGANEVLLFKYGSNILMDTYSWYGPNTLSCSKTTDENQNEILEYTDKQGHVVCKKVKASAGVYASTYYIYDDFGNLVVVLPPEAIQNILTGN